MLQRFFIFKKEKKNVTRIYDNVIFFLIFAKVTALIGKTIFLKL